MRIRLWLLIGLITLVPLMSLRDVTLAANTPPVTQATSVALPLRSLHASTELFLPLTMAVEPATVDLAIDALEITQSIQNSSNSVPLVANRPTVVRVYLRSQVQTGTTPTTSVALAGTLNGVPLPGSPLLSNPATPPTTPSRAEYASSVNFTLPDSWLNQGALSLTAFADPTGSVRELDRTNNQRTVDVTLNTVPTLDVKIVPIRYTHTNGQVYQMPPPPNTDTISDWIKRSYPISNITISFHSEYPFTGNLSNSTDWRTLLDAITTLRDTENAPPSQVYYGLIPTENASGAWFRGGISGLGWIGWRASLGLNLPVRWGADLSGQTAAHEIGHNMGRLHAPCGVSGTTDAQFPYGNGSIGEFGLDISRNTLWNPDTTRDMMSYCDPAWLSDYTYRALYENQRSFGAVLAAAPANSLMVRAWVDGDQVTLDPSYQLEASPNGIPASSDFHVELFDERGQLVASYPVSRYELEHPLEVELINGALRAQPEAGHEPEVPIYGIRAVIPLPITPVAQLRLLHHGNVVAQQTLNRGAKLATAPSVSREGDAYVVRWSPADQPVLVRYTPDDGASWQSFAVDLVGGIVRIPAADLGEATGRFEVIPSNR